QPGGDQDRRLGHRPRSRRRRWRRTHHRPGHAGGSCNRFRFAHRTLSAARAVRRACASRTARLEASIMPVILKTIVLLTLSNLFMTFAWYAHLKHLISKPWFVAAIASWLIAFFEYLLQVP